MGIFLIFSISEEQLQKNRMNYAVFYCEYLTEKKDIYNNINFNNAVTLHERKEILSSNY